MSVTPIDTKLTREHFGVIDLDSAEEMVLTEEEVWQDAECLVNDMLDGLAEYELNPQETIVMVANCQRVFEASVKIVAQMVKEKQH